MRISISVLASAAFAACVYAQSRMVATELSFGHEGRLSKDRVGEVSNFVLLGEPSQPMTLSNKIILTPPMPGNARGGVWGVNTSRHSTWATDVEFRATGPEWGGGKLVIWLVKDGRQVVGTSSIYTVGKFDGLALVIDTYAGSAGMLRGFLNDGKTDFKSHHSVDSLAFGHCNYAYRNLGRLSQIKIKQEHTNFRVEIDGILCFESNKVQLPIDYTWGITAVSAEVPDTFEVYKLVVTTDTLNPNLNVDSSTNNDGQKIIPPSFSNNFKASDGKKAEVPNIDTDRIKQEQQLKDLQTSLQGLTKQISDLQQRVSQIPTGSHASHDDVKALDKRLAAMEQQMQHIRSAVADKDHIEDLKRAVKETHSSLLEAVPRHSFIIVVLLAGQALLVAVYFIYKRKRANTPKKYV